MNAFIGGTPAAGKSYVAKKFVKESGINVLVVSTDDFRVEMAKNPDLEKWVNLFWKLDEQNYWETTSYEKDSQLLMEQSEAFFPTILEKLEGLKKQNENLIIEGVNLLPHLVGKLGLPGFFLISEDYEAIFERLKSDPRWGQTDELQTLEAKFFIEYDARFIKEQAAKYDYKVFDNYIDALAELKRLFQISN